MLLAAGTDFVQIAIYAAVLIAGLLGALLQKRERDQQHRGAEPPKPPRGRPVPRAGRVEPDEPLIILPPEHRPAPPLPPIPPGPAPPRQDRPEADTTRRTPRPAAAEPARVPRAQPVGERPTPQRTAAGRPARTVREERSPSRRTPPQPPSEPAVAEEARPAGARRAAIPVEGLVRALLARRDGVAAAFVISEILAPPVSLRENDPTRLI
jgi:hypothetical protein